MAGWAALESFGTSRARADIERGAERAGKAELRADLVVIGGGLGGCAAALAGLRRGLRVVWTEETDWIGGQLTQQAVPPDEHRWIETCGCTQSYRRLRDGIRQYYKAHYPLTQAAREHPQLNPGNGSVSRLCHEPKVALAMLESFIAPYLSGRQLTLLLEHDPIRAEVEGDRVRAVTVRSLRTGNVKTLIAPFFLDATEMGDLLPLTRTEFVTGAEARSQTGEAHAPAVAAPRNHQACTACFAVDVVRGGNEVIEKPREYDFWRNFTPQLQPPWPGKLLDFAYTHPPTGKPKRLGFNPLGDAGEGLLNLWLYRRIADQGNFSPGAYGSDICLVNWPQNDYFLAPLIAETREARQAQIERAKQLSLSLLYWLQTEAPRPGGGGGFPELRLRADVVGTEDGLAKLPYVRESRRIQAVFTVVEQHVSQADRHRAGTGEAAKRGEPFFDSVGIGSYPIDLHPTTGFDNYIDFQSVPFQIPLGALLPQRIENLLPAAKNLGVTHITNGCYRLHPVEWNIGEAAAALAAYALRHKLQPRQVRAKPSALAEFQEELRRDGFPLEWPAGIPE